MELERLGKGDIVARYNDTTIRVHHFIHGHISIKNNMLNISVYADGVKNLADTIKKFQYEFLSPNMVIEMLRFIQEVNYNPFDEEGNKRIIPIERIKSY